MRAAEVYRSFIEALNRQDLGKAERLVDPQRHRENCVGFTHGFVDWEEAKASINQVWKGIPNLCVELHDVLATEDVVLARGTVRGTATGDGGLIVERVQQADVLGQMRQLYGKAMDLVGLGAMLWRC